MRPEFSIESDLSTLDQQKVNIRVIISAILISVSPLQEERRVIGDQYA